MSVPAEGPDTSGDRPHPLPSPARGHRRGLWLGVGLAAIGAAALALALALGGDAAPTPLPADPADAPPIARSADVVAPEPRATTWDAIRARGEIVWAADRVSGAPYVFEDPKDPSRVVGFEVDLMDELARRLGVRQRLVQVAWSELIPALARRELDLAMNGLEATAQRSARVLWSRPYYVFGETLAVAKGSAWRSLDDLVGRRVGTFDQSRARDILRARRVDVVAYEGSEELYTDLVSGRLDGVLLDDLTAARYGCSRSGVECLPGDVARGTYAAAMRPGDDALKAAVDGALEAMQKDGRLEAILRRWDLWNARQAEPLTAP
ncbi:MAG: ABC transporter substrate-binding protein [Myxococcota bacterium]